MYALIMCLVVGVVPPKPITAEIKRVDAETTFVSVQLLQPDGNVLVIVIIEQNGSKYVMPIIVDTKMKFPMIPDAPRPVIPATNVPEENKDKKPILGEPDIQKVNKKINGTFFKVP